MIEFNDVLLNFLTYIFETIVDVSTKQPSNGYINLQVVFAINIEKFWRRFCLTYLNFNI